MCSWGCQVGGSWEMLQIIGTGEMPSAPEDCRRDVRMEGS
jgi:hypothetical protein